MEPLAPPCIDVCGKRTLDYVIESLAKSNRTPSGNIILRGFGSNISKGVGISQILASRFGFIPKASNIFPIELHGVTSSVLEISLELLQDKSATAKTADYLHVDDFIQFPIYHLLFDLLLWRTGNIMIEVRDQPTFSIRKSGTEYSCKLIDPNPTHELLDSTIAAYYRSGLVLSPEWRIVADVLSSFDDVIIGVDTNVMLNAAVSEQILSSLFLIDSREYVHTPNWVLLVIPNAVIHELEQAANSRNDRGQLTEKGRIGYRALEEMVELNRSADLAGISVMIVGEANPVLDTQVELRGLRDDFAGANQKGQEEDAKLTRRSRKKSSGDMMIRAQYKQFLRQIDFHKGVFFLTSDKSNAALARAEGLHAIYYKPPASADARKAVGPIVIPCGKSRVLTHSVPIGKLIYELTVQFGTLKVGWPGASVELSCDRKGESLDHWLARELRVRNSAGLKLLLSVYSDYGKVPLPQVTTMWQQISELLLGSETIVGWGKTVNETS